MSRLRAWIQALSLAAVLVLIDQVTKSAIESRLAIGETVDVIGPLQLTNVGNTGIAFGLAGGGGIAIVLLTFIALALIVGVFARDPTRRGVWLAVGLLLGGAAGNLIDRIAHEAVTDFIKLPKWPSFNVADIAITLGVILLGWVFLRQPDSGRDADDSDADGVETASGNRS